ncbi:MAG: ribonuclease HII [Candidatus Aenigmatarchaeota archaeon]
MKKILGIDEAGRGCVIGPLVMCGYLVSEEKEADLKKMGARDSKLLSPRVRSQLYQKFKEFADDVVILKISAEDIDKQRSETNLNKIEIKHMQHIINALNPDRVVLDSIEANTKGFRLKILHGLKIALKNKEKTGDLEIISENFADKHYPIVGAASIMAKVVRDAEIIKLAEKYGDFGSGYTSDPRTIKFLKEWLNKNKQFPTFVRKSWVTVKEMKKNQAQKALLSFVEIKKDKE